MLAVYTGPMFAGKSTCLIEIALESPAGFKAFRPKLDSRVVSEEIRTHTGVTIPCHVVQGSNDVFSLGKASASATNILIDEAQFFDEGIADVALALSRRGHDVYCAGLAQDWRGAPFKPMPMLMTVADQLIRLIAPCVKCESAVGSRTFRLAESTEQVSIGGSAEYQTLCDRCYVTAMNAKGVDYVGKTFTPQGLRLVSPR